jgi:hypothetical protein
MVLMLRDFGPYGIRFMIMYAWREIYIYKNKRL